VDPQRRRAVPALSRARRGGARVAGPVPVRRAARGRSLRDAAHAARTACASSPSTRATRPVCSR
jgi:hypothetical protein